MILCGGSKHERLPEAWREHIYTAFEQYENIKGAHGGWDQSDRVMALLHHMLPPGASPGHHGC